MLPFVQPRPDDVCHWISYWTDRIDAYFVWFHEMETSPYEYGPSELAALLPKDCLNKLVLAQLVYW